MSTSSPHWHTILCYWIYQSDSRCAKYKSWCTPVLSCQFADLTLSRTFSVCFLYVSDLSRVTPRYCGAKSCASTSPVPLPLMSPVSVFWQPVCCPGGSRSPLSSLHLGAASSSQSTHSGVRCQETVYSQDVKRYLIVWQGSSHQHVTLSAIHEGWLLSK